MKKYIYGGVLTLLLMGVVLVPSANAETTAVSSMFEQIKALMAKVEELQKQLATIRGEIKAVIREGVGEGMTGDDVKKVQELLATDPMVYPEGKVTGYFGPLTKEAVKRFQQRHELEVTGVIDEATRDLLEEYLKERFGENVPPGLLRAPGIAKKMELRIKEGCDNSGPGKALFCKKLKIKYGEDDDSDEDDDDDSDDELEVEIETENGSTTVEFTFEGDDYSVTLDGSVELDDILAEVADELNVDVEDLDEDLVDEIEDEFADADEDEDDELDEEDEDDDDDDDDDEDDEDDEDED